MFDNKIYKLIEEDYVEEDFVNLEDGGRILEVGEIEQNETEMMVKE